MFISLIGTWVQTVALSWLVFQLTNSAFLLGVVGFLGSIPIFLLTLFGGVIADRVNKKRILLFTQTAFMVLAFILAVATQMHLITPLQIMLIALLNGIVMAFDAPSRQAVVVELVGKSHLLNALALNSAAFNSARIIGPALAAIFVSSIGMSGCFYLNGVSFLAVIIALLLIKIDRDQIKDRKNVMTKDLLEGLRFIGHNRIILILISMVGMISLFGVSYVILMPIFAGDILKVGIKGLGLLMSVSGVGALIAALGLARLGDFKHKGRLLIFSSIIFSLALILFSFSRLYLLSLTSLLFIGFTSVIAMGLVNTLLQTLVPDNFRGRIMSAFMFTFAGVLPFGNLISGSLAQILGVSWTVAIGGIICSLFFMSINIFFPTLRNL